MIHHLCRTSAKEKKTQPYEKKSQDNSNEVNLKAKFYLDRATRIVFEYFLQHC